MDMSPQAQHMRKAKEIMARRKLRDQNTRPDEKGEVEEVKKLAEQKNLTAEKEAREAAEAQKKADEAKALAAKEAAEAEAAAKEAQEAEKAAKSEDPYAGLKNKDLKKLLDARTPPVKYAKTAKRDELIGLLENN